MVQEHSSAAGAFMVQAAPCTVATMEYKERLKDAMKAASVDTRALANALGVSYQAVKKVIDGDTKSLTAENNSKAAIYLKVNTDWLATGDGPRARGDTDRASWEAVCRSSLDLVEPESTRKIIAMYLEAVDARAKALQGSPIRISND